jgi:hypothetical protein
VRVSWLLLFFALSGCINTNTKSSRFYDSAPETFFGNAVRLNIEDNGGLLNGKYARQKSFSAKSAVWRAFSDSRYFKTVISNGESTFTAHVKVTWHHGTFSLVDGITSRIFFLIPYKSYYPITVTITLKDKLGGVVASGTQHDNVLRVTAWALTPVGIFFLKKNNADEELIYRLTRKALIDCRKELNIIEVISSDL